MTSTQVPALPLAYWDQAREPLCSLAFVLPLLAVYEAGVVILGPTALRNGADLWLRALLEVAGLGGYFLLPVLTIGSLLAWHHTTRRPWRIGWRVVWGMHIEAALLGMVLVLLAQLQGAVLDQVGLEVPTSTGPTGPRWIAQLLGYCGAGIYEEVLFRLLLFPAAAGLVTLMGGGPRMRVVGAVVLTSGLFSAAHYVGLHGEAFVLFTFAFRFLAGAFFAVLFVYRGFGIAAGSHALYDIFVGLL